jgi:Flp pilus assembly pilin Flp
VLNINKNYLVRCLAFSRAALNHAASDNRGTAGLEYAFLTGLAGIALIGLLSQMGDGVERKMTETAQVMVVSTANGTGSPNAENRGSGQSDGDTSDDESGGASSDNGVEDEGGGTASDGRDRGRTDSDGGQNVQEDEKGGRDAAHERNDDRPGDDRASDTASAGGGKNDARGASGPRDRVGDDCGRDDSRGRDDRCHDGTPGGSHRHGAGRG